MSFGVYFEKLGRLCALVPVLTLTLKIIFQVELINECLDIILDLGGQQAGLEVILYHHFFVWVHHLHYYLS